MLFDAARNRGPVHFLRSFVMNGFAISPAPDNADIKQLFFENELIGEILYSASFGGFLVYPSYTPHQGFFRTLESAIIELVFHYYTQNRSLPNC